MAVRQLRQRETLAAREKNREKLPQQSPKLQRRWAGGRRGIFHLKAASASLKRSGAAGKRSARQLPSKDQGLKTKAGVGNPDAGFRFVQPLTLSDKIAYLCGETHWPDSADLKIASITAMLPIESSKVTGPSVPSLTALAKASPCIVY